MQLNLLLPTEIDQKIGCYSILNEEYLVNVDFIERGSKVGRGYAYHAIIKEENFPNKVKKLLLNEKASFLLKNNQLYGYHIKVNINRNMNAHFKLPPRKRWYHNTPAFAEV